MRAHELTCTARGFLSALAALVLAGGCGGVDSGGTGAVAIGPITGFGSVIVNGVRFDETTAALRDDEGAPIGRERLALGVSTEIEAFAPSIVAGGPRAVASSIRVASDLVGAVSAVDTAAGTLTVLGQTVLVTPATAFDAALAGGLTSVTPGSTVEVYGRLDPARAVYTATRIESRTNPVSYKLRGLISAVDAAASTLAIGGQTIDYSGVAAADRGNIAPGNIVRARLQTTQVAGVWIALALPSGVAALPDRQTATVEGRISSFTSTRSFSVGGVSIDAGQAAFPNGEAGIVLGARVAVEGSSRGGVLHARTVESEGDESAGNSSFELEGSIESIDATSSTFRLRGISVDYSGPVTYQGGGAADLAVGRIVDVHGVLAADGLTIRAQSIEFEGP